MAFTNILRWYYLVTVIDHDSLIFIQMVSQQTFAIWCWGYAEENSQGWSFPCPQKRWKQYICHFIQVCLSLVRNCCYRWFCGGADEVVSPVTWLHKFVIIFLMVLRWCRTVFAWESKILQVFLFPRKFADFSNQGAFFLSFCSIWLIYAGWKV